MFTGNPIRRCQVGGHRDDCSGEPLQLELVNCHLHLWQICWQLNKAEFIIYAVLTMRVNRSSIGVSKFDDITECTDVFDFIRFSAPSLWNSLPQTVLISDSLSVFFLKSRLKTFLFNHAFTEHWSQWSDLPPVPLTLRLYGLKEQQRPCSLGLKQCLRHWRHSHTGTETEWIHPANPFKSCSGWYKSLVAFG